jgi:integrase
MHMLVEYAMWAGMLEINRNPISLVRNTGATRKTRKARSLTAKEFHALLKELQEPFATMALLSVCLGLRISEVLAVKWSDVRFRAATTSARLTPALNCVTTIMNLLILTSNPAQMARFLGHPPL